MPEEKGVNPVSDLLSNTGKYFDGFGNRITMVAYVNPSPENMHPPADNGASGYGLVRFNKRTRKITMECWPRGVDVTKAEARQYPGFPVIIDQQDNYGREAVAYLPMIEVVGVGNPVVQIIDESTHDIVYTIRINNSTFHPKVYKMGKYTIKVGEGEKMKQLTNVESTVFDEKNKVVVRIE